MGSTWSGTAPEDGTSSDNIIEPEIAQSASDIPVSDENITDTTNETNDERKQRIAEEINKFREDLAAKRDLRKKKLYEVSDEMNKLKQQLEQEMSMRKELEQQLNQIKQQSDEKFPITDELIVTKYSDDDDEIDILDEEDDGFKINDDTKQKKSKKKVSFSLELVKELNENETGEDNPPVDNNSDTNTTTKGIRMETNETDSGTSVDDKNDEEVDEMQELKNQNLKLESQIKALKDVANLSKQLLALREAQVEELNNKLLKIDDKEKELERKMEAMKELRKLYEERGRAMILEHKNQLDMERTRYTMVESKLRFTQDLNEELEEKVKHMSEKVKNLDNQLDDTKNQLSETKIKLATEKESLYHASSQIKLINNLVTQIISGPELDLDHLARFLQENHALIAELTAKGEIDYVASALVGVAGGIVEIPKEEKSDIAENLTKVWKVLVELLSHHKKSDPDSCSQIWESCYKSVNTPKGPKLEISVSQTFIKLKDLILEKNSLVKEVTRLKTLNSSLENRMEEQEDRLSLVTEELHNTWDVVNKLKKQHNSLHMHEKILKHELQHKRGMLNGLKKQLEVCREQWQLAREKNSKTENDWLELRNEFRSRKIKRVESGFEDEPITGLESEAVILSSLDTDGVVMTQLDSDIGITLESEVTSPEYDTDLEEEISDNSNCDNNILDSLTPSETSESESNLPISEILDNIIDEAYNIVKNKQNTSENECENKYVTDLSLKRLEQIPEEEEDRSVKLSDILTEDFTATTIYKNNDLEQTSDLIIISQELIERNPQTSDSNSEKSLIASESNSIISKDTLNFHSNNSIDNNVLVSTKTITKETSPFISKEIENSELVSIGQGNESIDSQKSLQENQESAGSTIPNQGSKSDRPQLTTDEILRRRDERLKRMEESCKTLFVKMGETSSRGSEISNKLDQIHATYGPQAQSEENNQSGSQSTENMDSLPQ